MNGQWQILRVRDDVQGEWTGDYRSAEEALASLEREISERGNDGAAR
jgi:hypothetical protein